MAQFWPTIYHSDTTYKGQDFYSLYSLDDDWEFTLADEVPSDAFCAARPVRCDDDLILIREVREPDQHYYRITGFPLHICIPFYSPISTGGCTTIPLFRAWMNLKSVSRFFHKLLGEPQFQFRWNTPCGGRRFHLLREVITRVGVGRSETEGIICLQRMGHLAHTARYVSYRYTIIRDVFVGGLEEDAFAEVVDIYVEVSPKFVDHTQPARRMVPVHPSIAHEAVMRYYPLSWAIIYVHKLRKLLPSRWQCALPTDKIEAILILTFARAELNTTENLLVVAQRISDGMKLRGGSHTIGGHSGAKSFEERILREDSPVVGVNPASSRYITHMSNSKPTHSYELYADDRPSKKRTGAVVPNVTQMMNYTLSTQGPQAIIPEAYATAKAASKAARKVPHDLSDLEADWLTAIFGTPIFVTKTITNTNPHNVFAAGRELQRENLESDHQLLKGGPPTLFVGATFREVKLYHNTPGAHFLVFDDHTRDVRRSVQKVLTELTELYAANTHFEVDLELTHSELLRDYLLRVGSRGKIYLNTDQLPRVFRLVFCDTFYYYNETTMDLLFQRTGASLAVGYMLWFPEMLDHFRVQASPHYRLHTTGDYTTLTFREGQPGYSHVTADWNTIARSPVLHTSNGDYIVDAVMTCPFVNFCITRALSISPLPVTRMITAIDDVHSVHIIDFLAMYDYRANNAYTGKEIRIAVSRSTWATMVNTMETLDMREVTKEHTQLLARRHHKGQIYLQQEVSAGFPEEEDKLPAIALAAFKHTIERNAQVAVASRTSIFGSEFFAWLKGLVPRLIAGFKDFFDLFPGHGEIVVRPSLCLQQSDTVTRAHAPVRFSLHSEPDTKMGCPWCDVIDTGRQEVVCKHKLDSYHTFTLTDNEVQEGLQKILAAKSLASGALQTVLQEYWDKCLKTGGSHNCQTLFLKGAFGAGKTRFIKNFIDYLHHRDGVQDCVVGAPVVNLGLSYEVAYDDNMRYRFGTPHKLVKIGSMSWMFFDECTLFDKFLAIIPILMYRPSYVVFAGDEAQIWLNQALGVSILHSVPLEDLSTHIMTISFRCESSQQVAFVKTYFPDKYAYLKVVPELPRHNVMWAVRGSQPWTRVGGASFMLMSFDTESTTNIPGCQTVYSCQGMEWDYTAVLLTQKGVMLMDDPAQVIVAATRFRKGMWWVSDGSDAAEEFLKVHALTEQGWLGDCEIAYTSSVVVRKRKLNPNFSDLHMADVAKDKQTHQYIYGMVPPQHRQAFEAAAAHHYYVDVRQEDPQLPYFPGPTVQNNWKDGQKKNGEIEERFLRGLDIDLLLYYGGADGQRYVNAPYTVVIVDPNPCVPGFTEISDRKLNMIRQGDKIHIRRKLNSRIVGQLNTISRKRAVICDIRSHPRDWSGVATGVNVAVCRILDQALSLYAAAGAPALIKWAPGDWYNVAAPKIHDRDTQYMLSMIRRFYDYVDACQNNVTRVVEGTFLYLDYVKQTSTELRLEISDWNHTMRVDNRRLYHQAHAWARSRALNYNMLRNGDCGRAYRRVPKTRHTCCAGVGEVTLAEYLEKRYDITICKPDLLKAADSLGVSARCSCGAQLTTFDQHPITIVSDHGTLMVRHTVMQTPPTIRTALRKITDRYPNFLVEIQAIRRRMKFAPHTNCYVPPTRPRHPVRAVDLRIARSRLAFLEGTRYLSDVYDAWCAARADGVSETPYDGELPSLPYAATFALPRLMPPTGCQNRSCEQCTDSACTHDCYFCGADSEDFECDCPSCTELCTDEYCYCSDDCECQRCPHHSDYYDEDQEPSLPPDCREGQYLAPSAPPFTVPMISVIARIKIALTRWRKRVFTDGWIIDGPNEACAEFVIAYCSVSNNEPPVQHWTERSLCDYLNGSYGKNGKLFNPSQAETVPYFSAPGHADVFTTNRSLANAAHTARPSRLTRTPRPPSLDVDSRLRGRYVVNWDKPLDNHHTFHKPYSQPVSFAYRTRALELPSYVPSDIIREPEPQTLRHSEPSMEIVAPLTRAMIEDLIPTYCKNQEIAMNALNSAEVCRAARNLKITPQTPVPIKIRAAGAAMKEPKRGRFISHAPGYRYHDDKLSHLLNAAIKRYNDAGSRNKRLTPEVKVRIDSMLNTHFQKYMHPAGFDDSDLDEVVDDVLRDAAQRHYAARFDGEEADLKHDWNVMRFSLKDGFKMANLTKGYNPDAVAQGIASSSLYAASAFMVFTRMLVRMRLRAHRKDDAVYITTLFGKTMTDFTEEFTGVLKRVTHGDPAATVVIDQIKADSGRSEILDYAERQYAIRLGFHPQLVDWAFSYYNSVSVLGSAEQIDFSLVTDHELMSGLLLTMWINEVHTELGACFILQSTGPMLLITTGDDGAMSGCGITLNEQRHAEWTSWSNIGWTIEKEDALQYCGLIVCGDRFAPDLYRRFISCVSKVYKKKGDWDLYRPSLIDYMNYVHKVGYMECVMAGSLYYGSYTNPIQKEELEAVYYVLKALTTTTEEEYLKLTKPFYDLQEPVTTRLNGRALPQIGHYVYKFN